MRSYVPQDILDLAHARAAARRTRDWPEADRLKALIEAEGWKVVDSGVDFRLEPARPPDLVQGGRVRYGSSASVPALADEPAQHAASVILVATDRPTELARALDALRLHAPPSTQVVVVADDPNPEQAEVLEAGHGGPVLASIAGQAPEVVWTARRLGFAAAINAGTRRASGEVVVLLDPSVELTGDALTPLVAALADMNVGVAGAFGLTSPDGRHFSPAPAGAVDAVASSCMAFRRADAVARGPVDERFRDRRSLDAWWSFVLRDQGPDASPRGALALDLALVRHEPVAEAAPGDPDAARSEKRDRYRIIGRFGRRRDLLLHPGPAARRDVS
jgi:hypothetical protein